MSNRIAAPKWTRKRAGFYEYGDWVVSATEGEDRSPGYNWYCHHVDGEETYFTFLKSAKKYVTGRSDKTIKDPNFANSTSN